MCGLAGVSQGTTEEVRSMLKAIEHRGPDNLDLLEVDGIILGHVRLSIQDPDARSNQPMRYGQTVITFAGEVYNWPELRAELEADGLTFQTSGDTELVAAAMDHWGEEALDRFEGMYTIAAVNEDFAILARDPFGKLPLYIADADGLLSQGVAWASERKGFIRDYDAANAWPLPAGSVYDLRTGDIRSYYNLEQAARVDGPKLRAHDVRALLEDAVRKRLQLADVPVCCLISGGLDSSAILALSKRLKPDLVAYTAYADPDAQDLLEARKVARSLDVPLREVHVPWPGMKEVKAAATAIEIAMKAQVEIATLCLPLAERISQDGFKVVLSGEGADEVFGGYGSMARKAKSDESWRDVRVYQVEKMARGNFIRTNKVFMSYGVEARLPFLERRLVEGVLRLGLKECPPGKGLLKDAVADLVPASVVKRPKQTFQGGAGVIEHLDDALGGNQVKTYNDCIRETFGALVKG